MTQIDLHAYIDWLRTRLVLLPDGAADEAALRLELARALSQRYDAAGPDESVDGRLP